MGRRTPLAVARAVLKNTICRCGHLQSEHVSDLTKPCDVAECAQRGCRCREFAPVKFVVRTA